MVKAFKKKSHADYIHRESASKKIVKVNEGENRMITSRLLQMTENYEEFVNYESVKFKKIQKTTQIKTKIDKEFLKAAIKSLILDSQKKLNENSQEAKDDFIILDIKMGQVPESYSIKPYQIKLPFPIYKADNSSFCILAKDPCKEVSEIIKANRDGIIKKVIGNTNYANKYPKKLDIRHLCNSFDYFLCDYRIYNSLSRSSGSVFYSRKKIPFPIDCQKVPNYLTDKYTNLQEYWESFKENTFFMLGNGPIYSVKIGRLDMNSKEILKNLVSTVYILIPLILKSNAKHTSVLKMSIRTPNSISLPFFPKNIESE